MSKMRTTVSALALGLCAVSASTGAAWGDEGTDETKARHLDTIVVTSRKKEESIQTVPLAITAFTGESLEAAGAEDIREISYLVPGFHLDDKPGKFYTAPVLRGVAQVSSTSDENNTSVFIDGVYVSGRDGLNSSFLDLERVEVVKGPQSALYGRNSYAGAINFITKKPTDEMEASASATVGSSDKRRLQASMSGPVVPDLLSMRISAAYDHFGGGYESTLDGGDLGGYESLFLSNSFRLTPTNALDIILSTYYALDDIDTPAQVVVPGNCIPATSPIHPYDVSSFTRNCGELSPIDPDTNGYLNLDTRYGGPEREISRSSLTANWDLGPVELTSISGYNFLSTESITDQDRQLSEMNFYTTNADYPVVGLQAYVAFGSTRQEEKSQEIRLQSDTDGPLEWLVGASYYFMDQHTKAAWATDISNLPDGVSPDEVISFLPLYDLSGGAPDDLFNAFPAIGDNVKNTTTYAIYGSVAYDLTEKLTGRVETRYTEETKDQRDNLTGNELSQDFNFVTPRFTLDYQADSETLLYASAARGAKAGGFNTITTTLPRNLYSYDPETNWTYEVGAKKDWLDGLLRTNVSLFRVDMDGIQISSRVSDDTADYAIQNAGTGSSTGFELEVQAHPVDGLDLTFGYGYADSKFEDAEDGNLASLVGTIIASTDVSGQQLPKAVKHTLNGTVQYTKPVTTDVDGFIRLFARYESPKKLTTHDALESIGERFIGNIRGGVKTDNWEATLWVDNVFDDDTPVDGGSSLLLGDFSRLPTLGLPTPRTYGMTVSVRY
jgi:iron complex outermembrane recepter protein